MCWCVLSPDDCGGLQTPWASLPADRNHGGLRLHLHHLQQLWHYVQFCVLLSHKINSGDCVLCGEMCIASRVQIIYEGTKCLTSQSHPPGADRPAGHWGGAGCPTISFARLNISVDVTIHSITCSPGITGRSWCISYPFPQKILFSISFSCPLFSGF